jgi:hypothetical protein
MNRIDGNAFLIALPHKTSDGKEERQHPARSFWFSVYARPAHNLFIVFVAQ